MKSERMARVIQIERDTATPPPGSLPWFKVLIDGEPFPWFVRPHVTADFSTSDVPFVTVDILCERVEFSDPAPPLRSVHG